MRDGQHGHARATIYHGRFLASLDARRPELEPDSGVLVEDGRVIAIDHLADLRRRAPAAHLMGGEDVVVLPGLVDAHQHGRAVTSAARGIVDQPLETWLLDHRGWPQPVPRLNARIAGIRLLLAGVTTAAHPHIAPPGDGFEEHTRATALGLADAGLRVSFGLDVKDRASYGYEDDETFLNRLPANLAASLRATGGTPPPETDELDALLDRLAVELRGTLLDLAIAPRGPQWCTPSTLEWVAQHAADGRHVHTHCAETRAQYGYFAAQGTSPVRHLEQAGLLRDNVTLAHAVWLDASDVAAIASAGAHVSHNPSSNLRLASGIAPVRHLRRRGIEPGIGSDSIGTTNDDVDLFAECRLARHLEMLTLEAGIVPASADRPLTRLAAAMAAGRRGSGHSDPSGQLTVGGPADIVLLDWHGLTSQAAPAAVDQDPATMIALRAGARHVRDVVVAGEQLVAAGRYLRADLDALEGELAEQLAAAGPRAHDGLFTRLRPHVAAEAAAHAAAGAGPFVSDGTT